MPIVINRKTGVPLEAPELDEETKRRMWNAVVRAFVELHPETIENAVTAYQQGVSA